MFRFSKSLSVSLLMALPVVAGAQWSSDPNDGLRVDDGINVALSLFGFPDHQGGAVFSWGNYSAFATIQSSSLQRVSADGYALWRSQDANLPSYNQYLGERPAVADSDGNTYVVHQDTSEWLPVVVQKFNPYGEAQWPGLGVRVSTFEEDHHREDPLCMVLNDDNTVIVFWRDNRITGGSTMFTQKIGASGERLWGDAGVRVSMSDVFSQTFGQCVSDDAGGAILIWVDSRLGSAQSDIFAQRISADGQRLWGDDDIIVCDADGYQRGPKVKSDGNGGAVVIWQDSRATRTECYVQRIDGGGNSLWAPNGIPFSTTNIASLWGDLLVQDDHAWVMSEFTSGYGANNIRIQKFDLATGTRQLGNLGVGVLPGYYGEGATFETDSENGVVVAWRDHRTTTAHNVVYAQRLDAAGEALWETNGVPISTYPSRKTTIALVPVGGANTIVGWVDERNDTSGNGGTYGYHINPYAAYLLPDGTLLGTTGVSEWQLWQ